MRGGLPSASPFFFEKLKEKMCWCGICPLLPERAAQWFGAGFGACSLKNPVGKGGLDWLRELKLDRRGKKTATALSWGDFGGFWQMASRFGT